MHMTDFNYGGKIGLSTVIRLVVKLCDIYIPNAAAIITFVNDTTILDSTQKATLIAWLNGVVDACTLLKLIMVKYER